MNINHLHIVFHGLIDTIEVLAIFGEITLVPVTGTHGLSRNSVVLLEESNVLGVSVTFELEVTNIVVTLATDNRLTDVHLLERH